MAECPTQSTRTRVKVLGQFQPELRVSGPSQEESSWSAVTGGSGTEGDLLWSIMQSIILLQGLAGEVNCSGEGQGREETITFSTCPEESKNGGTFFGLAIWLVLSWSSISLRQEWHRIGDHKIVPVTVIEEKVRALQKERSKGVTYLTDSLCHFEAPLASSALEERRNGRQYSAFNNV